MSSERFWEIYYSEAHAQIERACRSASRCLTDNTMCVEDMVEWVEDRLMRMQREGGWPVFDGEPGVEESVERVTRGSKLLARWAYMALSRRHWRRQAGAVSSEASFERAATLGAVRRVGEGIELDEGLKSDLAALKRSIDHTTLARLAATWPEKSEARRVAVVLGVTDEEDERLLEDVMTGRIKANTVDQMRSRARARVRTVVGQARELSGAACRTAGFVLLAGGIALGCRPAVAGEQTGGGRQEHFISMTAAPDGFHGTRFADNARADLGFGTGGGEQTGGGRGG